MSPMPPRIDPGSGGGLSEAQVDAKVSAAVAALVDSAPSTLDTLNELSAALGDDDALAAHLNSGISAVQDEATAAQSTATGAQNDIDAHEAAAVGAHASGAISFSHPDYDPASDTVHKALAEVKQNALNADADASAANGAASNAQIAADAITADLSGLKIILALYDFDDVGGSVGNVQLTQPDGSPLVLDADLQVVVAAIRSFTPLSDGGFNEAQVRIGTTSNQDAFLNGANDIAGFAQGVGALGVIYTPPVTQAGDAVLMEITNRPLVAGRFIISLVAINMDY